MPESKFQSVVFTLMMVFCLVFFWITRSALRESRGEILYETSMAQFFGMLLNKEKT
jgi:hypothetical protein